MNKGISTFLPMKQLASLFLKLGIIGFGGPAAHIAMMRNEVVVRKKWMTDDDFLSLVGITNLIPGPNSTEMALTIGKVKGGWRGLLIAGFSFIVPAVLITLFIAVLYVNYGTLPEVTPFLSGIKPAIIAIIISAVYPLAKSTYRSPLPLAIGIISFALSIAGYNEVIIMLGAGFIYLIYKQFISGHSGDHGSSIISGRAKISGKRKAPDHSTDSKGKHSQRSIFMLPLVITGTASASVSVAKLFFIFLKIGAILYGSGYVLFAFLETDLVSTGILSRAQLTDAIAVGQMTPGPVFSSVTFIGYTLKGWQGAIFSTVGIFLPSFLFIALLSGFFQHLKNSSIFMSFLTGVIASSVALIAAVGVTLGVESIIDWRTALIALAALCVTFFFKRVNSAFIVLGGAFMGYVLSMIIS